MPDLPSLLAELRATPTGDHAAEVRLGAVYACEGTVAIGVTLDGGPERLIRVGPVELRELIDELTSCGELAGWLEERDG